MRDDNDINKREEYGDADLEWMDRLIDNVDEAFKILLSHFFFKV
jgi:hypothetical protein